jgi:hypothetical protein
VKYTKFTRLDIIERVKDPGVLAYTLIVEHPKAMQLTARSHPKHSAIIRGAHESQTVGSVTLRVVKTVAGVVVRQGVLEIGVGRIDTRVNHRDASTLALSAIF